MKILKQYYLMAIYYGEYDVNEHPYWKINKLYNSLRISISNRHLLFQGTGNVAEGTSDVVTHLVDEVLHRKIRILK